MEYSYHNNEGAIRPRDGYRIDLLILNVGDVSTFRYPGYEETIPDISLAFEGIVNRIYG